MASTSHRSSRESAPNVIDSIRQHLLQGKQAPRKPRQPMASGSKTRPTIPTVDSGQNTIKNGSSSGDIFKEGQEFIAFGFKDNEPDRRFIPRQGRDNSSQGGSNTRRDKGKERMREEVVAPAQPPPTQTERKDKDRRERLAWDRPRLSWDRPKEREPGRWDRDRGRDKDETRDKDGVGDKNRSSDKDGGGNKDGGRDKDGSRNKDGGTDKKGDIGKDGGIDKEGKDVGRDKGGGGEAGEGIDKGGGIEQDEGKDKHGIERQDKGEDVENKHRDENAQKENIEDKNKDEDSAKEVGVEENGDRDGDIPKSKNGSENDNTDRDVGENGDISKDEERDESIDRGKEKVKDEDGDRERGKDSDKDKYGDDVRGKDEDRKHQDEDWNMERRKHRERNRGSDEDESRSRDKSRRRDRSRRRDKSRRRDRSRSRDTKKGRDEDDHRERDEKDKRREERRDRGKKRDRSYSRERNRDREANDGHTRKNHHSDAQLRRSPWLAGVSWGQSRHVAEILHSEVEAFVRYISPSPVEHEIRYLIIELVRRTVVAAFPDAAVFPFGSYETKLYLPLGDIDLVVLSVSMAYSDKVTVLHALAHALKSAQITERVTIIAKAKVPIVKFVTTYGRFNVDISINQQNGMVAGTIINGFLHNMHPSGPTGEGSLALRSLVMITKAFLNQRNMNEVYTGGLGSYSIVCLAISFLQMEPKIRRGEIDPNKNLGVLLMEFFELYGCYFNYAEVGISVRDGGSYFSKRQRGWFDQYKSDRLSIEDPADPSNDISSGSFGLPKVRATFAGAHGILTSTAYLVAGILESRRSGRAVSLRDRDAFEEPSILSSIMDVTQETINHRKLVQELYDKRILHNMLGFVGWGGTSLGGPPTVTNSLPGGDPKASGVDLDAQHAAEDEHVSRKRHHDEIEPPENDDDQGRYGIDARPPKLRRIRYEKTVFIADDEEEEDSLAGEEAHYATDDVESGSMEDTDKSNKRRSYWLSKGISNMA